MYLNVVQLAESLGVEENVVEGWIRNEGLPCVRDAGRLLFDRAQVGAWAAERGLAAKTGFLAPVRPLAAAANRLAQWLQAGGIVRDLPPENVLAEIERRVTALPGATPSVQRLLAQRVRAPDGITWAPIGHGLALPHLRAHVTLGREAGLLAIIFLKTPLALKEAPADGVPVTRLLFFVAPSPRAHLETLALLSTALARGSLRALLERGASDSELFAQIEGSVTCVEPARTEDA